MDLLGNIIINTFSIVVLAVIGFYSHRHSIKRAVDDKLYMSILLITALMLVICIFGRLDGTGHAYYHSLNAAANFILFFTGPVVPCLWLTYVLHKIFQDREKTRRLLYVSAVYCGIYAAMLAISVPYGWFYYIDADNYYHKGPYFIAVIIIAVAPILIAMLSVIKNRKMIEGQHYRSFLIFPLPPMICIVLHTMLSGFFLVWNGVVLALLIIFLSVQDNNIYTDFLTEIYNRKKLEGYLEEKICKSTGSTNTFAAILLDLDNFKSINDIYGHGAGDEALRVSAKLLKDSLRYGDLVARFGGDEFFCVLEIRTMKELEDVAQRIKEQFQRFNESNKHSYQISFSMGYDLYDCRRQMGADEFEKHIDDLLYKDKCIQRQIRSIQAY